MKKLALISVCVLGLAVAGNAMTQTPAKKEAPKKEAAAPAKKEAKKEAAAPAKKAAAPAKKEEAKKK